MSREDGVFVWCPEKYSVVLNSKDVCIREIFPENRQRDEGRVVPALRRIRRDRSVESSRAVCEAMLVAGKALINLVCTYVRSKILENSEV